MNRRIPARGFCFTYTSILPGIKWQRLLSVFGIKLDVMFRLNNTEKNQLKSILAEVTFLFLPLAVFAGEHPLPIIDMHLHSYDEASYFVAPDEFGKMAPATTDAHFDATHESMRRHNIVKGVIYSPILIIRRENTMKPCKVNAWFGNKGNQSGKKSTDTQRKVQTPKALIMKSCGCPDFFVEEGRQHYVWRPSSELAPRS